MALFVPMMSVGALIPFPPLIFGSSMAWWLLASAIFGLLVLWLLGRRGQSMNLSVAVRESCRFSEAVLAIGIFLFIYLVVWLGEAIFGMNLTVIVPIFRGLASLRRFAAFPTFVPFYLPYFLVEGLYLHRFRIGSNEGVRDFAEALGLKVSPYLALLLLQYGGMYLLGFRLLSGFVAFFVEFIWAVVPLLVISIVLSWWLYRLTSRIGTAMVLNTLLFAWISATLFPFGSFS